MLALSSLSSSLPPDLADSHSPKPLVPPASKIDDGVPLPTHLGSSEDPPRTLTHLDLVQCVRVTDDGLRALSRLPALRVLHLHGCVKVSGAV